MSLRRALTDPTSSVDEAIPEQCLALSFDCLTSNLRILARKICRGAPLNHAVIVQAALERLDLGFAFRRQLPIECRCVANCASLSQKEPGGPDRDLLLCGGPSSCGPGYGLRPLRFLNCNVRRHAQHLPSRGSLCQQPPICFTARMASGRLPP